MWLALLMLFVGVANGLIVFRVMTIDPLLSPNGCFMPNCWSHAAAAIRWTLSFFYFVPDIEWPLHWVLEWLPGLEAAGCSQNHPHPLSPWRRCQKALQSEFNFQILLTWPPKYPKLSGLYSRDVQCIDKEILIFKHGNIDIDKRTYG